MDKETTITKDIKRRPLITKGEVLEHKICGKCIALEDEAINSERIKVRFKDMSIQEIFICEINLPMDYRAGIYLYPEIFKIKQYPKPQHLDLMNPLYFG